MKAWGLRGRDAAAVGPVAGQRAPPTLLCWAGGRGPPQGGSAPTCAELLGLRARSLHRRGAGRHREVPPSLPGTAQVYPAPPWKPGHQPVARVSRPVRTGFLCVCRKCPSGYGACRVSMSGRGTDPDGRGAPGGHDDSVPAAPGATLPALALTAAIGLGAVSACSGSGTPAPTTTTSTSASGGSQSSRPPGPTVSAASTVHAGRGG